MKKNLNRSQSSAAVDAREDFDNSTGSFRGRNNPVVSSYGQLNSTERGRLAADILNEGLAYLVWSYDTPIAWVTRTGRRYRVSQKFSQTTSCHMGLTFTSSPAKVEA